MGSRQFVVMFGLAILVVQVGCAMTAPISLMRPAMNQTKPIHRIAMVPVTGPTELAAQLDETLINTQPRLGQQIALISPRQLEAMTNIQLASFNGQASDLAGLSAARRVEADVLVVGQILNARTEPQEPKTSWLDFRHRPSEKLTVSWTVYDAESGEKIGFHTVSIDKEQAVKDYPDLRLFAEDGMQVVVAAVSRKSWEMFSPTVVREETILDLPWFSFGSSAIRKGNGYARQGRWDLAQEEWQAAAKKYRTNKSAWHNLAVGSVAAEDFELARRQIDHAKSWTPWNRAKKTELWIDRQQYEYHQAMGLPPREGGWLNPTPPPPREMLPPDVEPVPPIDIEDLPWWTAIPGTKPPGWTWSQWINQPWAM